METKISTKNFSKLSISISKKEKRLLIILLFAIFLWVVNKFTLSVQSAEILELEQKKDSYEAELNKINAILEKDKPITDKLNEVNRDIKHIRAKYFSDIDQPKIMSLLNDIIDNNNLNIPSMNFSEPDKVTINDMETMYIDISIPFEGSYEELSSFFSQLRSSSKKFLVTQLTLSKNSDNLLSGEIGLNAYSYDEAIEGYTDYSHIQNVQNTIKENPFKPFEGYKENNAEDEIYDDDYLIANDNKHKTVLENFENSDVYFMTSSSNATGKVSLFNNSKYGNHSLRMEYLISTYDTEERAYVVLDDKDIILKYPPSSIGVWAHSYAYLPATIGLRFKDQEGNKIDLELARGVNWKGWEYIEGMPPQDINIYPLKLDRIYLQLGANRDDYGVILFDNLEALYPKTNKEYDEDNEDTSYIFYVVQYGDTLESISEKIYGTKTKTKTIMNQNGLNDSDLEAGQILVIPK